MLAGIFCGFLTAFLQVASYFISRAFLQKSGNAAVLLTASQVLIGVFSLPAAPFLVPWGSLSWRVLPPLVFASFTFLVGQFFFFKALNCIESSRIASMMGLKVVAVPVLLSLFWGEHFVVLQWVALLMAMIAAVLINYRGGALFAFKGTGYLFITIPMYALSDIGVNLLILRMPGEGLAAKAAAAALLNNILLGVTLFPLIRIRHIRFKVLPAAAPYALCWGASIVLFFVCFGYLGAAFGNVVQAARGPLSLLAGILLVRMGLTRLEEPVGWRIWTFRTVSTLLMAGAILLYAWTRY